MTSYVITVDIEPKDEGYDGRPGYIPGVSLMAERLQDILCDATKHDEIIGWRVTRVTGMIAGGWDGGDAQG